MKGDRQWLQNYLGTPRPTLGTRSADIKSQAAKIIRTQIHSSSEFYDYISHQYSVGKTFEDYYLAATVFAKGKKYHPDFKLNYLSNWLDHTAGWAEVDTLCQSNFSADFVLNNWTEWSNFLDTLSLSPNPNRRRASLVLLCKPLRQSTDIRLFNKAIFLVNRLKSEKIILITKAVSWVLRSAVKNFSPKLSTYLSANKTTLPPIAYRETYRKLTTGRK